MAKTCIHLSAELLREQYKANYYKDVKEKLKGTVKTVALLLQIR